MTLDILKVIKFEQKFFGPLYLGVVSLRLDTCWTQVSQFLMRYVAYACVVRWPWPVSVRLDFAQYSEGGFLDSHIDPVRENEFQMNSVLLIKKPQVGGELLSEMFVYCGKRLKIIRPNLYRHEVTRVEKGERWVLNLQLRCMTKRTSLPSF